MAQPPLAPKRNARHRHPDPRARGPPPRFVLRTADPPPPTWPAATWGSQAGASQGDSHSQPRAAPPHTGMSCQDRRGRAGPIRANRCPGTCWNPEPALSPEEGNVCVWAWLLPGGNAGTPPPSWVGIMVLLWRGSPQDQRALASYESLAVTLDVLGWWMQNLRAELEPEACVWPGWHVGTCGQSRALPSRALTCPLSCPHSHRLSAWRRVNLMTHGISVRGNRQVQEPGVHMRETV